MADRSADSTGDPSEARISSILVPTDFSEASKAAVDFAVGLAKQLGARVIFCHSLERFDMPSPMVPLCDEGYPYLCDRATAKLNGWVSRARQHAVEAAAELLEGIPFVQIIDAADRIQPGLIVMGTYGRTGLAHVLVGSQAEQVMRKAPGPVLTVKGLRPGGKSTP